MYNIGEIIFYRCHFSYLLQDLLHYCECPKKDTSLYPYSVRYFTNHVLI